jgi:capsular exopolysaccharide synthesis family protein
MSYDYSQEEFEEREIHLRDYLRIMVKRKYLILTVLGLVFCAVVIKTYTTKPIYTASSQVLLERNLGSKGLENASYRWEPDFLDTQAEIIQSAGVAKKVVQSLQLATRYRHYFFKDTEEVSLLDAVRKTLSSFIQPVKKLLSARSGEESENGSSGLPSPQIEPKTDEEIIAGIIQGGLRVSPGKNSKVVSISYSASSPVMAKLVADAVVKAYMDEILEIKLSTSSYSVKWMTDKAQEEREKLEHSERELQQFMRENDLVTVENKLTVQPQKLSEFGRQISTAETEKKELQDLLAQIKAAKNDLETLEKIPNLASSEVLKSIRERIYKARQTVEELSKKYGPKHPKMIKANDELRILNNEKRYEVDRILSSITNSYDLASSKEKSLKELLAGTKAEMLNMNEKFMQYQIMKRDVDSNRVMYETLQASIKKEGVTEQSQSVNIWVISKAELPGSPSKPNTKRNLMLGLILGLFSGIGLSFFIEYLDNTIKDGAELEDKFGFSVLGSIEEIRGKTDDIESFIQNNPLSPVAESYRLIRSGLLLSSAGTPPKTILITSMSEKEGKTSTTANLARILAQGGKNVLVIDCDLRRPRMQKVFGIQTENGLSSYLSGGSLEGLVQQVPGEAINLICSGPIPPSPAELLGSDNMKQLVDGMTAQFDFVLLDSPPVQSVTDSLSLCQYVDGTIIVVRAGKTTNEMLESGLKKLKDVQAHVFGFVINGIHKHDTGSYYYGYSSYYAKEE